MGPTEAALPERTCSSGIHNVHLYAVVYKFQPVHIPITTITLTVHIHVLL